MITRAYFISCKSLWDDGSGSYTFKTILFYRRSWLPCHNGAYVEIINTIKEELKADGKPYDNLEVQSFSRIS